MNVLLSIEDLTLIGQVTSGSRILVDRLSIMITAGESLALVGESGSGKSITALAILDLLPESQIKVDQGKINFAGQNLLTLSARQRRQIAGNDIAMIFQEPMTSLNPVMRVGEQIVEMIHAHEKVSGRAARARAAELLTAVRIPEPIMRLRAYPHQLSGGQRQRVMIAMALACRPKLLIADEPTTALDVTVQAQILALLRNLQRDLQMAMLFITHDLGVVANIADRVAIIYCGQLAETAEVHELFRAPRHPYTRGLLECVPNALRSNGELIAIPGQLPGTTEPLTACRFAPRCSLADHDCHRILPPPMVIKTTHVAHCHHTGKISAS